MIIRDPKTKFKHESCTPVARTPENESERLGVIKALDKDVADMKTGKVKSHKYSLSEFEEKF